MEINDAQIYTNVPKVRFTYIKLTLNLRKQRAPYFTRICCNTNFSTYISKGKKIAFSVILGETDQHEDQSKDILNPILKEELSDSDSEALIEEL